MKLMITGALVASALAFSAPAFAQYAPQDQGRPDGGMQQDRNSGAEDRGGGYGQDQHRGDAMQGGYGQDQHRGEGMQGGYGDRHDEHGQAGWHGSRHHHKVCTWRHHRRVCSWR